MSTAAWIAAYVAQALIWVHLLRQDARDLREASTRGVRNIPTVWVSSIWWVLLVISTLWFIAGVIAPAAVRGSGNARASVADCARSTRNSVR